MSGKDTKTEAQYYLDHIASYDKEFAPWTSRVVKILKRYKDDQRQPQDTQSKFNILWSNVQTLRSATFARLPKPDVSRRYADNDPVGRVASLILERALDFEITTYRDYRDTLKSCVDDRFLGGRGVGWVRYEPHIRAVEQGLPEDGTQVTEDTDEAPQLVEELEYECAPTDYVHWRDFGHNVVRSWAEVTIVWRKVYMTKEMIKERFPDYVDSIPLDASPKSDTDKQQDDFEKRALVYEIWDKEKGIAVWISKSLGNVIDERDDPLGLHEFFPCGRPIYATLTNDSLIPVPDFSLYQDQARTLDILSERIEGLVKALQVKGFYDSSNQDLGRLFSEANNTTLIPIQNYNSFAEKGGLRGAVELLDLSTLVSALAAAYQAFEQVKSQIYDITGISDIIRGQSMASETATAQQIKGQYASLRLKTYQEEVGRLATDFLQNKAQIICKHFAPETILKMSAADQLAPADQQYIQPALELLRNDPVKTFRIEVQADSLVMLDENQQKQERIELLTSVGGFLEKGVNAAQSAPELVPLLLDLLKFGVASFKAGKSIEGTIDQAEDQFKEKYKQKAVQPPPPDPEQIKMQQETQMFQQKQQMEAQKHQADLAQQAQVEQLRAQLEHAAEQRKMERESMLAQQDLMFRKWQALLEAQTKIDVAQISAKSVLMPQQDAAADQAVM